VPVRVRPPAPTLFAPSLTAAASPKPCRLFNLDGTNMDAKRKPPKFKLQFKPEHISAFAARYSFEEDTNALAAGRAITRSDFSKENLRTIVLWKTRGRGISRFEKNSDTEVEDVLGLCVAAKTNRAKLAVLLALRGVDVPVASAILMCIYPKTFTVIDFRALEGLGTKSTNRSIDYYFAYNEACLDLAKTHGVTLRELDRALWQWSRERRTTLRISATRSRRA
jgi:hypothetical protein